MSSVAALTWVKMRWSAVARTFRYLEPDEIEALKPKPKPGAKPAAKPAASPAGDAK